MTGNEIIEELLVTGLIGPGSQCCDLKVPYVCSSPGAELACGISEIDDLFHWGSVRLGRRNVNMMVVDLKPKHGGAVELHAVTEV